jgi:hypothetical protein
VTQSTQFLLMLIVFVGDGTILVLWKVSLKTSFDRIVILKWGLRREIGSLCFGFTG